VKNSPGGRANSLSVENSKVNTDKTIQMKINTGQAGSNITARPW